MTDPVNHPQHYKSPNGLEAIDVIEGFGLGFHLGNVVKYILRAPMKGGMQDFRKSRWYLDRVIKSGCDEAPALISVDGLKAFRLCYLATPYSKYDLGLEAAFVHAAELAAKLLQRGVCVYSPIAHTHPLSVYGKIDPLDHSIWLPFDARQMDAADCLIVARMQGWRESFGVQHEIETFKTEGKPIVHLDPVTLAIVDKAAA